MQEDVDNSSEPDFKSRIINTLNKQSADNRWGIHLRFPGSAPAHGLFANFEWSEEQATRYITNGTLPCNLTTIDPSGKLPEVEFERVPDFDRFPTMCAFDMDGKAAVVLIPSGFLEMVPTGPKKVQFVLNEDKMAQKEQRKGSKTSGGEDGKESASGRAKE